MTLEELKAEANKLGYSLIKKKPYIPIKPCPVCGKKCTNLWYGTGGKGTMRQCSFEVAALLPTQGGFFFGGTEYDNWYMRGVEDTIDILTRVLETTDFEKEMVYYVSSW